MITGERISLRSFERSHLEKTRVWANDPELARLLDRARPVSDLEHEQWFARLHESNDCVYFAIELNRDSTHIGNIWLWDIDWRHKRAELRVLIGETEHQDAGIGTEAISLACIFAFQRLNLHKIYAYTLAFNYRASRAFEKAGFKLEGTLLQDRWAGDSYSDVYLFGKLNE